MSSVVLFYLALHLFLFALSFYKVFKSKEKLEFIYAWAFIFGAFVWEDLLVLSFFNIFFAFVVYILGDIKIGIIFLLVFFIVRAFGETIYYFLQQFNSLPPYPHRLHAHFKALRSILGDISDQKCFILGQVLFQCITVLSTVLLILFLRGS